MYTSLHVKRPLFLLDINDTWIFLTDFSKNTQISNFMQIRPMGSELFHAEEWAGGQTEMKLIVAFRNFANAPKNLTKFSTQNFSWKWSKLPTQSSISYVWCMGKAEELLRALTQNFFRGYHDAWRIRSVVLLPMEMTLNGIVCRWNKAINEVLLWNDCSYLSHISHKKLTLSYVFAQLLIPAFSGRAGILNFHIMQTRYFYTRNIFTYANNRFTDYFVYHIKQDIKRTVNVQPPAILQVRESKIPNMEVKFQYNCCSPDRQPDLNFDLEDGYSDYLYTFFLCPSLEMIAISDNWAKQEVA